MKKKLSSSLIVLNSDLITKVIKGLSQNPGDNSKTESEVRKEVIELCSKFPIYSHLFKN